MSADPGQVQRPEDRASAVVGERLGYAAHLDRLKDSPALPSHLRTLDTGCGVRRDELLTDGDREDVVQQVTSATTLEADRSFSDSLM